MSAVRPLAMHLRCPVRSKAVLNGKGRLLSWTECGVLVSSSIVSVEKATCDVCNAAADARLEVS